MSAFECIVQPNGAVAAAHYHPLQSERFEILEGTIGMKVNGEKLEFGPGHVVKIEPGTRHKFWNAGEGALRLVAEVRPALASDTPLSGRGEACLAPTGSCTAGRTSPRSIASVPLAAGRASLPLPDATTVCGASAGFDYAAPAPVPPLATSEAARLRRESLATTWLAARLGIEPERVDVMRRGGELLGFRIPGGQEYYFPVWQFDRRGEPLPWVERVAAAARDAGVRNERLYEVLCMRAGVIGGRRLADLLREGDEEAALAVIRSAA